MSERSLFRREALAGSRQRLWGDLLMTSPPGTTVFVGLLLAALAAAAVLLYRGELTRTERVSGYLVPHGGVLLVEAPEAGVIERLTVREGDEVAAGEPLLEIRDPRELVSGGSSAEQNLAELERALARADRAWAAQQQRLAIERTGLQQSLQRLDRRAERMQARTALLRAEAVLAQRQRQRLAQLHDRQHVSEQQLDAAEQAWLRLRERQEALAAERLAVRGERNRVEQRLASLPIETALRETEYQGERGRLLRERSEVRVRWQYVLRAPAAGRVAMVAVEAGDTVRPGRSLLTLMPPEARMQAVLLVPSRAAGFIEPGQSVRLRYDAFPHVRFGSHPGTVESVSHSVLAPNQLSPPAQASEPVYKARVRLQREQLLAYGKPVPLQAGMALEADVELDRRRLWAWLLEPLLALRGRL